MPLNLTVIGASNVDIIAQPKLDKKTASHEAISGDSLPGVIDIKPGGVARNIAENLGRLGLEVRLISAFGDDAHRPMLDASLTTVNLDGSVFTHGNSDSYLSLHNEDGDMTAAINQMGLVDMITPAVINNTNLNTADMVVVDANLSAETIAAICAFKAVRVAEAVSAFKCEKLRPFLPQLNLLKCNCIEAESLTGLAPNSAPNALLTALHDLGVEEVLLSLGSDGFIASNGKIRHQQSAPNADEIVSVNGAGDALMAGYLYGKAHQLDLPSSAAMAGRAAAITLTCAGAVHPAISAADLHDHNLNDHNINDVRLHDISGNRRSDET